MTPANYSKTHESVHRRVSGVMLISFRRNFFPLDDTAPARGNIYTSLALVTFPLQPNEKMFPLALFTCVRRSLTRFSDMSFHDHLSFYLDNGAYHPGTGDAHRKRNVLIALA